MTDVPSDREWPYPTCQPWCRCAPPDDDTGCSRRAADLHSADGAYLGMVWVQQVDGDRARLELVVEDLRSPTEDVSPDIDTPIRVPVGDADAAAALLFLLASAQRAASAN